MARRLLAALAAAALVGGCADGSANPGSSRSGLGEVTVFAASSLTDAFGSLGVILERERRGTRVTFNFASSSDLAVQITEGAPVDVFASADPAQMKVVEDAGDALEATEFATNRLVILVPKDNPAGVHSARDVARTGVKLVLAAPEVPAGNYARRAFARLGIAGRAEANVVSNEEDVKAVVAKVALGEADAGVAYATDVTDDVAQKVTAVPFPPAADIVAHYPIATLEGAPNPKGARAFYDLVTSPRGRRVLQSYGFGAS